MEQLSTIIWTVLWFWVYFIPTFIAHARGHHNIGAITLFNVLLGWTVLGWIAALVWSATAVRETSHA